MSQRGLLTPRCRKTTIDHHSGQVTNIAIAANDPRLHSSGQTILVCNRARLDSARELVRVNSCVAGATNESAGYGPKHPIGMTLSSSTIVHRCRVPAVQGLVRHDVPKVAHFHYGVRGAIMAPCLVFRSRTFLTRRTQCSVSARQPRTSRCRSTCARASLSKPAARRCKRSWIEPRGERAGRFPSSHR